MLTWNAHAGIRRIAGFRTVNRSHADIRERRRSVHAQDKRHWYYSLPYPQSVESELFAAISLAENPFPVRIELHFELIVEVPIETSVTHESTHYVFRIQVPELHVTTCTCTCQDLLDDLPFLDNVNIMLTSVSSQWQHNGNTWTFINSWNFLCNPGAPPP